jgi:alcohol dehydrogenase
MFQDPAQILIGITSLGAESERVQADWPDGTLVEYVLVPPSTVALADVLEHIDSA